MDLSLIAGYFSSNYWILHLVLALFLLLLINLLGNNSLGLGYNNVDSMQEEHLGLNLFIRILTPPIYIGIMAIVLYFLNLNNLNSSIWLVAIYYSLFQLLVLIIYERIVLINLPLLLFTFLISASISYIFQKYAIDKDLVNLLPDSANLRTEIWILLIGYLYALLAKVQINNEKKVNHLVKKYQSLSSKYGNIVKDCIPNNLLILRHILYSMMIYEDYNRPRFIRRLEKIFSKIRIFKTTGIMQVHSSKTLTDQESISKAAERLKTYFQENKRIYRENPHLLPYQLPLNYNGQDYANHVLEIYNLLQERDKFNQ